MIRSNGFRTIFAAAVAVQIAAGQFTFFPGLVGQQHNKKEAFFWNTISASHFSSGNGKVVVVVVQRF